MKKVNRNQPGSNANADQRLNKQLKRKGENAQNDETTDQKSNTIPHVRQIIRDDNNENEDVGNYGRGGYYGNTYNQEIYNQDVKRSLERQEERENNFIGKGPRSDQRPDNLIFEDVNDKLCDDPYIDASNIEVTVSNGIVILKGAVENVDLKWRAEDLSKTVSGVKNVENLLHTNKASRIVGPVRSKENEMFM